MRLIVLAPLLLRVLGQATVARSAAYPKPVFGRKEWPALADWVKVIHGQVVGLAADLTPRTLAADLAAQLLPGWIKVWVWLPFLPAIVGGALVH
jgi:hypothetical protein